MPARTPTALKLVKGTAKAERINPLEPKPQAGRPKLPSGSSPEFRKCWRAWCRRLTRLGLLTVEDGPALEGLVDSELERAVALEALRALGEFLIYQTENQNGGVMYRKRPEIEVFDQADRRWRQWLQAFGQTPADRSRVSMVKTRGKGSFDDF